MRHPGLLALLLVACFHRGAPPTPNAEPTPLAAAVEDPVALLERGATSQDPSVRGRALAWLVRCAAEPGGGPWALVGSYDGDPWVQRQVVDALLARGDDAEALRVLLDYLRRPSADPYVRGAAALRAGERGDPRVAEAVGAAWRAEPASWSAAPLALAAARLGDQEALQPLSKALSQGDVALEPGFLLDVGSSGLVELRPALQAGTEWIEDEMRVPYAVARLGLGDADGRGELERALGDADSDLRIECLDLLVLASAPAATDLIRKARSGQDLASSYASLALAARGEGAADTLARAAVHPDRDVRLLAVRMAAAAARGDPPKRTQRVLREVVRAGLADEEIEVRAEALRVLSRIGLDGEEEWVRARLGDEYLTVQVEAAGVAIALGVPLSPVSGHPPPSR